MEKHGPMRKRKEILTPGPDRSGVLLYQAENREKPGSPEDPEGLRTGRAPADSLTEFRSGTEKRNEAQLIS